MCDDNTTMKKASEYWGALTNEGVIYLMESGITRVSYITFLFICQHVGADGKYHGTINSLFTRMTDEFNNNDYMQGGNKIHKIVPHAPSKQAVYNTIQELENNKLIYKKSGVFEYFVNPLIYYKGGRKENKSLLIELLLKEGIDPEDDDVNALLKEKGLPVIPSILGELYSY